MIKETNLEINEKHLNSLASYKRQKGDKMEKNEGCSRGKTIVFKDQKVQGAYEELKKVVEEKKIDVMKLFL